MVSAGYLAIGLSAIGVYAVGVAAKGLKIAVGVAASGETAVGREAAGIHILLWRDGPSWGEVEAFLLSHHPGSWRPLLRFLGGIAAALK